MTSKDVHTSMLMSACVIVHHRKGGREGGREGGRGVLALEASYLLALTHVVLLPSYKH